MYYSLASQLALILNLIVNRGALRNIWTKPGADRREQKALIRYSWFIIAANCYFASDIAWGFLEAHHENPALFPIFYSVTVFYFIFQFWTMLAWLRYIVAYLDKRGRRSKILLYSAWTFFVIGLIYLIEALSVMIQVGYYKKTKKRIFKMAPIHHHFEMCGWNEYKVFTVFTLVSAVFAVISYFAVRLRS